MFTVVAIERWTEMHNITPKCWLIGIVWLLGGLISGCQIGKSTKVFVKPLGPTAVLKLEHKIRIPEIGYPNRLRSGLHHELLAIEEKGLLIKAKEKIILVEYEALMMYRYDGKGPVLRKRNTAAEIKEKIINMEAGKMPLLVRFPQGVTAKMLDALLNAYNQDTLIVVRSK